MIGFELLSVPMEASSNSYQETTSTADSYPQSQHGIHTTSEEFLVLTYKGKLEVNADCYRASASAMPALKKFDANVARHVKSMNKNLCANLIRHDYIVTGRTKAKRAQAKIESFLGRAFYENKLLADKPLATRLKEVDALNYLQPPDKRELSSKVLEELSKRYKNRTHGFTRIIKLEPRLGTDRAPMSVLELVDSDFEIKFWYTAKIVARLELQSLPLDDLTKRNVEKLVQRRPDGKDKFRKAVEEAKVQFFSYDAESGTIADEDSQVNLKNKPSKKFYNQVHNFTRSKKFQVKQRNQKHTASIPKSPFLAQ